MRTMEQHPEADEFIDIMESVSSAAFSLYKQMLQQGCPRELARSILPLSTYTRFFGTVDLHNLFHFLRLRLNPHAQYEIRVYAEALQERIRTIVPVAHAAFVQSLEEKKT